MTSTTKAVKPAVKAPALLTGTAAIDKAILSIGNRGKKLDADIQICGLSVLAHVEQHGDITLFTKLYMAMPAGSRRNAIVDWAVQFGKIDVNLNADKKERPFLFARGKRTDLEAAMAKPWYECKPEKALDEEFDFVAKLQSLLAQASKARESGKPIKGAEQLDKIIGFCAIAPAPVQMITPETAEA